MSAWLVVLLYFIGFLISLGAFSVLNEDLNEGIFFASLLFPITIIVFTGVGIGLIIKLIIKRLTRKQ